MNYQVVEQSAEEIREPESSPSVCMQSYLAATDQEKLLTVVSVYAERGETREALRILYMNKEAMRVWLAMGKNPRVVGERHRPPKSALLAFGVPFSE